jgi:hypothetical protein
VLTRRLVGGLLAISLPLYFAWELLQMPAFTGPPGWLMHLLLCAAATVLDATLVLALYGVGARVFRDRLVVPAARGPAVSGLPSSLPLMFGEASDTSLFGGV